ncbi:MAG: serine/threonine-protein phosphatase [Prevotella sp.]|nr:serine/threonine-protein phosphatase [Prevotella sp.]
MEIKIYQPLFIHEQGKRDNQEDALWNEGATALDSLFIVCDGMGGHEKGEVASQTFSQALGKWFAEHVDSRQPLADAQLSNAITYAYDELDKQDDGNSIKKMGTTLTLLYIHAHGVTAAHIGDSRIYHIRPGYYTADHPEKAILYQSRDDSLVYELYQTGEISYEEMATHPQKNVITKAVTPAGRREDPSIIHITDIKPGDYFYLCSDGMLEKMSNAELATLFSTADTDEQKRRHLVEATQDNADNHTAWIIRVKDVHLVAGDPTTNEELTSKYNALNIKPKQQEPEVQMVGVQEVEIVTATQKPNPQRKRMTRPLPKTEKRSLFSWLKRWQTLAAIVGVFVILTTLLVLVNRSPKNEADDEEVIESISKSEITYTPSVDKVTVTTKDVYPKPDNPKISPPENNLIVINASKVDSTVKKVVAKLSGKAIEK